MATVISSIGLKGMEGYLVNVEVQLLPGLEGIRIVGLPNASVRESKERVIAALYSNGCKIPDMKIVINLSPAEHQKNSPIFDLAIAIGILKETREIKDPIPDQAAFLGLFSLNGTIKPVDGMLPAIMAAKKQGVKILYLPPMPDFPLIQIEGLEFRFVETLQETIESFSGKMTTNSIIPSTTLENAEKSTLTYDKDFKFVLGHKQAKRVLEIAAAGGHNVLMIGPPGCGKSLLAETFPSILPPLKQEGSFEVMSIYQLSGMNYSNPGIPPFRDPHHSSSAVSLIGGGSNPKPGEISLSSKGVLFLDEMAEFPKRTLDMLRQPIETGKVTISRAKQTVTYPADFILIGAMNPCPCGNLGSRNFYCTCSPKQITAYTNRISGPILDRMDIVLNLEAVTMDNESPHYNETSKDIRKRVIKARDIQDTRYGNEWNNAKLDNERLMTFCKLSTEQQRMIQQWTKKNNWSTRSQMKIRRLARTISDLSGHEEITDESIWEAVTLQRTKNRSHLKQNVN